jgi:hypothetical protein
MLSSLHQDGLRQIFDLFTRIIQENLKFSKSEKKSEKKFPEGIFYQILSHLAFFESFQNWFQDFLT